MLVAGPPVVNALGKDRFSRFELPGWEIQTRCGAVDHAVETEEERSKRPGGFFRICRPRSTRCCRGPQTDDPERRDEFLFDVIPRNTRQVYKMRPIVEAVVRQGQFSSRWAACSAAA